VNSLLEIPVAAAERPAPAASSEADGPLTCRIERGFGSFDGRREEWDRSVEALGGAVYMTYDWVLTWWKFYGEGRDLRVFVFAAGERIVGLLPMYVDRLGVGPFSVRIARLVGSNIPPKIFNPPVDATWAPAIWARVVEELTGPDGCDILSIGPMSELHAPADALVRAGGACGDRVKRCEVQRGVHSVFHLPATMDEYFEALSKNERKNRRKYELRVLKKECDTRTEVLSDADVVEAEFDRFARQHASQWEAQGRRGHFGDWPKAEAYNRELVRAQSRLGRVRFVRIVADGEVVASQYAFMFHNTCFWELPARAVGERWDRFSLGPTGLVTMIDAAIREGAKRLEGGLAHYDYKLRLNAREQAALTVRLVANRMSSRIRAAAAGVFRLALLYAYQKVWYRRIVPRWPRLSRGPQWMLWLRLDY
jgi:hypothetical protein